MRISIFSVGRMKKGAEQDLIARYIERLEKVAPQQGFQSVTLHEINESRAPTAPLRMIEESEKLFETLHNPGKLVVLDERGKTMSSLAFAEKLGLWRDEGVANVTFALGGPDGHAEAVRNRADMLLSFGAMTWPHQIARILLSEQLYRSMTILSGHPYHRE